MKRIKALAGKHKMNWFDYLNCLIMLAVIVAVIYPLYYCLIVSVSDGMAVTRGEVTWKPIGIDFSAYKAVFKNAQILRSYGNTIFYTVLGTLINLVMTALCAFPLSRRKLRGRHFLNLMCLLTMFVSGGMIPLYLQVKALHLLDTIWAIVLPGAISTYNMIILRTFFSNIPEELFDAAQIDGAGQFQTFLRIVIPLSKTIIATLVLFYAVGHWNGYMSSLLYLSDSSKMPLQMTIRKMVIQGDIASMTTGNMSGGVSETLITENKLKYAVVMVSVLPAVVIYPFLQKYFVNSVMVGSIKE